MLNYCIDVKPAGLINCQLCDDTLCPDTFEARKTFYFAISVYPGKEIAINDLMVDLKKEVERCLNEYKSSKDV